jgi:hypothetical protein
MDNGHFKKYYYGKFVHNNDFITDCMNNYPIDEKYLPIFTDFMNINLIIIKFNNEITKDTKDTNDKIMIFSNLYDSDRQTILLDLSKFPTAKLTNDAQIKELKKSFSFPIFTEKELNKMKYEEITQIALSHSISIYKQGSTKVVGLTKGELILQILSSYS